MIEPKVTAVLGRRLLAFLIDSSLVAATGLGVAFRTSTVFAVVGRDSADNALVDPGEFDAIEELLDFKLFGQSEILGFPVVRAQEVGDSYRVFGADSYQSGLLAALLAALVLFGLVPIVLQRTLGMLPFGLGIRRTDGTRASIGAHLKRTIVGFIDAIPFVIPGALGFIGARASTHRQRFGDRIAKTVVVDVKALKKAGIDGKKVDLEMRPGSEAPHTGMAAETERAVQTSSVETSPLAPTALDGSSTFADPPAPTPAPTSAFARRSEPNVASTTGDMRKPPVAKPAFGDPLPPPPVHRKATPEHPLGAPSDRGLDTSESSAEDATELQAASEVDAPTATAAEHLLAEQPLSLDVDIDLDASAPIDIEIPDETWQPPREEPAPVWQPTTLETAPVESLDPDDDRGIDDLERIDPSIGALLAEDSFANDGSTSPRHGNHSKQESSAKTPVWSDKWRAWMYWDTNKKCWLRHDTASNTWEPVD